jgi:hypothetical protein
MTASVTAPAKPDFPIRVRTAIVRPKATRRTGLVGAGNSGWMVLAHTTGPVLWQAIEAQRIVRAATPNPIPRGEFLPTDFHRSIPLTRVADAIQSKSLAHGTDHPHSGRVECQLRCLCACRCCYPLQSSGARSRRIRRDPHPLSRLANICIGALKFANGLDPSCE